MNNNLKKCCLIMLYDLYKYLKIKIRSHQHIELKKKLKHCGQDVHFEKDLEIEFPEKISIGNRCFIGSNVVFRGRGGISIGSNAAIAFNTIILSANHDYKSGIPFGEGYIEKSVNIGEGCWIGAGVIILPGVVIGEGVVIGAGAIIAKDIPPFSVVINKIETNIIGYRFDDSTKVKVDE